MVIAYDTISDTWLLLTPVFRPVKGTHWREESRFNFNGLFRHSTGRCGEMPR